MDYAAKFARIREQTLFDRLAAPARASVTAIAAADRLTQQELREVVEAAVDLDMWSEPGLPERWQAWREASSLTGREFKQWAFRQLRAEMHALRAAEPAYGDDFAGIPAAGRRPRIAIEHRAAGKIFGMCPVQSEKTLCCNLHTVDAVRNCGFGCSYCGIQTMFEGRNIEFDPDFRARLDAIVLDPARRYHIGTGQSSDALLWGNHHGVLDDLLAFARKWPNALLEFKSKSKNVKHLLRAEVPRNVICTWSLNPEVIIAREEARTATLAERLAAARCIADRGIRVGFHLHPMIRYRGWRAGYRAMIEAVCARFRPEEIVFVSFGALTFPKPILRKLRMSGYRSRIHQAPLVANPERKLTYPDTIKTELFRHAYESFARWHGRVFFYLCMEEGRLWEFTFGARYADNAAFETDLLDHAFAKIT